MTLEYWTIVPHKLKKVDIEISHSVLGKLRREGVKRVRAENGMEYCMTVFSQLKHSSLEDI